MRLHLTIVLTLLTFFASVPAYAADVVDHGPFDELLESYVDGKGRVAYAKLKENEDDLKKLNSYVDSLAGAKVKGSDEAKLAFYINAYNANVILSVVEKYPITSVMKVDGFFKKEKHEVAGTPMTLDHLENKIIRPEFNEARIHFVLVCAARSCPRLQRRAATEKNVEDLLETGAKEFIPKATKVKDGAVVTSQLFNWFADDFKKAEGSVKKYLAKYAPDHAELLAKEDTKVKFSNYSWKLNKQ